MGPWTHRICTNWDPVDVPYLPQWRLHTKGYDKAILQGEGRRTNRLCGNASSLQSDGGSWSNSTLQSIDRLFHLSGFSWSQSSQGEPHKHASLIPHEPPYTTDSCGKFKIRWCRFKYAFWSINDPDIHTYINCTFMYVSVVRRDRHSCTV